MTDKDPGSYRAMDTGEGVTVVRRTFQIITIIWWLQVEMFLETKDLGEV